MSISEPQRSLCETLSIDESDELMQKKQVMQRSSADRQRPIPDLYREYGPSHPSTHGVFQSWLTMNGEKVVGLRKRLRLSPSRH